MTGARLDAGTGARRRRTHHVSSSTRLPLWQMTKVYARRRRNLHNVLLRRSAGHRNIHSVLDVWRLRRLRFVGIDALRFVGTATSCAASEEDVVQIAMRPPTHRGAQRSLFWLDSRAFCKNALFSFFSVTRNATHLHGVVGRIACLPSRAVPCLLPRRSGSFPPQHISLFSLLPLRTPCSVPGQRMRSHRIRIPQVLRRGM